MSPASPEPSATSPMVVLVHGAWHGAWCWAAQQSDLDRRGIASLAIDLPGHGVSTDALTDMHGDAAHVSSVLDRLTESGKRPVVLIGHSYGGAVITQAAAGRTDIAHLVYIAAFAPDDGESVMALLGSLDRRDVDLGAAMVLADDASSSTLDPSTAAPALYGECPDLAVQAALQRLSPQPTATMVQAAEGTPRDHIDSTYVVCNRDKAVHPDHQASMSERCTHRVDIDTDHSPFLSAVIELGDVIEGITS